MSPSFKMQHFTFFPCIHAHALYLATLLKLDNLPPLCKDASDVFLHGVRGGNAPRQWSAMKRQTRRITECMDCSERGWCFLFFEQWPDGPPRGIWLCSDCIDRHPPALH